MPLKNFQTVGELQDYRYLRGVITSVDSGTDTCSVTVGDDLLESVPIFYHCNPDVAERDNGALEGAAGAFAVDDAVIVLQSDEKVFVVAHVEDKKACEKIFALDVRFNGHKPSRGTIVLEYTHSDGYVQTVTAGFYGAEGYTFPISVIEDRITGNEIDAEIYLLPGVGSRPLFDFYMVAAQDDPDAYAYYAKGLYLG